MQRSVTTDNNNIFSFVVHHFTYWNSFFGFSVLSLTPVPAFLIVPLVTCQFSLTFLSSYLLSCLNLSSLWRSPSFTLTLISYFYLGAGHLYWYHITSILFPVFRCSLFSLLALPSLYLDLLILLSKIYCFHYVSVSILES